MHEFKIVFYYFKKYVKIRKIKKDFQLMHKNSVWATIGTLKS